MIVLLAMARRTSPLDATRPALTKAASTLKPALRSARGTSTLGKLAPRPPSSKVVRVRFRGDKRYRAAARNRSKVTLKRYYRADIAVPSDQAPQYAASVPRCPARLFIGTQIAACRVVFSNRCFLTNFAKSGSLRTRQHAFRCDCTASRHGPPATRLQKTVVTFSLATHLRPERKRKSLKIGEVYGEPDI